MLKYKYMGKGKDIYEKEYKSNNYNSKYINNLFINWNYVRKK